VDVDDLNERLEVKGAQRLRHYQLAPDEALGLVFDWDGCLGCTREVQRAAWARLAEERGFRWPEVERPAIYDVRPERAIMDMLQWTHDFGEARGMAYDLALLYGEEAARAAGATGAAPGLLRWLEVVGDHGVPCAFVTTFSREMMEPLLESQGIAEWLQATVCAEDGMETRAHQLLGAAVKLARPPRSCVTFTADPQMVVAAHNCTMKAVGLAGGTRDSPQLHGSGGLGNADLVCRDLAALSVINMRNLFAQDGSQFMDLQKELSDAEPSLPLTSIGTQEVDSRSF
jgi:beta-phosphoglucomutase-like phosphatase (HAD superfamily)